MLQLAADLIGDVGRPPLIGRSGSCHRPSSGTLTDAFAPRPWRRTSVPRWAASGWVIGRHHRFKGVTHRAGLARHLGWIRRSADTPRAQAVAPTRSGGTGQHVRLDTEPIPGQGPLKLDGKNRSFAPTTTRIGTDGHASKLQTDPKTASASGSGEALPCLALHARIVSTTSGHGVAERFAPSPPGGHRGGQALRRR